MAKVNVLMPVYNGEKYLEEAIKSILDQTFIDFKFIIIDDGSIDKSVEIIKSFIDSRIELHKNDKNLKLIATLNKGLDLCNAEYIVRMDADDISLPERIEKQVLFMDKNPNVVCSGTSFIDFDEYQTKEIYYDTDDSSIRIKHLYQTQIAHPTAIWRTETIKINDLKFDFRFPHCEDYEFWTRMGHFGLLSNLPEILVKKREHFENVSNQYACIQEKSCDKVKINEFERIGVIASESQVALYARMAYSDFTLNTVEIEELGIFLNQLFDANQKTGYINHNDFDRYLSQKWFHLIYSSNITWNNKNRLIKLNQQWSQNFSLYSKAKMFVKGLNYK